MKWCRPYPGGKPGSWTWEVLRFHNLEDHEGNLLGWVREDTRPGHGFTAATNAADGRAQFPTVATLKEAKAQLIHHFVLKRLEDT